MLRVDGYEVIAPRPDVAKFTVRGLRSSGTNFVEQIIKRNTNLSFTDTGWKHGFNFEGGVDHKILVVIPFRHWQPWVLSMYRKPWHASDLMHKLPFSEFIRSPWDTFVGGSLPDAHPMKCVPLQSDRHPISGQRFRNLIELRNVKHKFLLGFRERDLNVIFVKMEWLVGREKEFVEIIRGSFTIGSPQSHRKVSERLASKYHHMRDVRPPAPDALTAEDIEFVKSQLDPKIEATLGYDL